MREGGDLLLMKASGRRVERVCGADLSMNVALARWQSEMWYDCRGLDDLCERLWVAVDKVKVGSLRSREHNRIEAILLESISRKFLTSYPTKVRYVTILPTSRDLTTARSIALTGAYSLPGVPALARQTLTTASKSRLSRCARTRNASRSSPGQLSRDSSPPRLPQSSYPNQPRPCLRRNCPAESERPRKARRLATGRRSLSLADRRRLRI